MSSDTLADCVRITRAVFYRAGGLSNPRCVRVTRGKRWAYFWRCDC